MIRAFIAIDLNEPIRRFLSDLIRDFKSLGLDARWARPENIHLTLKFLGEVSEEQLDLLAEALRKAAGTAVSFSLTVQGVGVFPSSRRPRIVWAGLQREPNLTHLQREVEDRMNRLGFEREQRPFKPHLTLARIRRPGRTQKIKGWLRDHSQLQGPSWTVNEITLFRSELTPEGARYTPLAKHRFADSSQLGRRADELKGREREEDPGGSLGP